MNAAAHRCSSAPVSAPRFLWLWHIQDKILIHRHATLYSFQWWEVKSVADSHQTNLFTLRFSPVGIQKAFSLHS